MRRLRRGIHSQKCVVGQFCHCANIIECTYTNPGGIVYYTPKLCGISYSLFLLGYQNVQHVTAQNYMRLNLASHKMCEAAAGITQHTVLQQTFL